MRISDWSSDVCSSDLNINTAESNHDNIVQTHSYADRIETIDRAKDAGLSPCSGLIAGLGESDEQMVEALFALDRKSVGEGKRVSVRVDLGGRRISKKKNNQQKKIYNKQIKRQG